MVLEISLQRGMVAHEFRVISQRRILAKLIGGFAVGVQELVEAREFLAIDVAIVLTTIVTIFVMQEGIRVLLWLCAKFRMLPQIRLQRRMVAHEFWVINQRRILAKLLGSFAVSVQELIEVRQFLTIDVAIAVAIVLTPIVARFLTHERVRIRFDLFAYRRMILQISLQGRMAVHKIIVIYQRGILADVAGDFGMAVQELIEVRELLAGSVVALKGWSILSGRGLRVYGCAEAQETRQS